MKAFGWNEKQHSRHLAYRFINELVKVYSLVKSIKDFTKGRLNRQCYRKSNVIKAVYATKHILCSHVWQKSNEHSLWWSLFITFMCWIVLSNRKTWWRHQMETFSASLTFCAGNPSVTGEFSKNGWWRGALKLSFMCSRSNCWANNAEPADLRHHRAHYGVTAMRYYGRGVSGCFHSIMFITKYDIKCTGRSCKVTVMVNIKSNTGGVFKCSARHIWQNRQ